MLFEADRVRIQGGQPGQLGLGWGGPLELGGSTCRSSVTRPGRDHDGNRDTSFSSAALLTAHGLAKGRPGSRALDLEPGVFQVEVALDAVHDLVADLALVAEPHDLAPLRLQQLADQSLVGQ